MKFQICLYPAHCLSVERILQYREISVHDLIDLLARIISATASLDIRFFVRNTYLAIIALCAFSIPLKTQLIPFSRVRIQIVDPLLMKLYIV